MWVSMEETQPEGLQLPFILLLGILSGHHLCWSKINVSKLSRPINAVPTRK